MGDGGDGDSGTAEFSESTPVAVGTAVWALLFVIGLFIRSDLQDSGRGWWIWSAAAGVVLGLGGYAYLRRRQGRIQRRAASSRPDAPIESDAPDVTASRVPDDRAADPRTPDRA